MLFKLPDLDALPFVREIAKGDWMMPADREPSWYYQRGYSALALVAWECQRARLAPRRILDFGCGHGCVARMFKAYFPKAEVVGQDVNPDWLDWCARVLGIETVVSAPTIAEVALPAERYDVIWAGSVFSHVPEDAARHLLLQFRNALTEDGIAIFSTAGQVMRNAYRPGSMPFITDAQIADMCATFDAGAWAFGKYGDGCPYANWGHALSPWTWFFARSIEYDMPLCGFYEAGWALVQDVFAMRKRPSTASWR